MENNIDRSVFSSADAHSRPVSNIESAPSVRFSMVAKAFGHLGAQAGFAVPGFRSPPRSTQTARAIRRDSSGSVVAVRIKDRPFEAVIADMIEGVVVCNGLPGPRSGELRDLLWRTAIQAGPGVAPELRHKPTAVVHRLPVNGKVEAA